VKEKKMGELTEITRNPRELKRLVGALQRASRRLPTLEGELASSREAAVTLQSQVHEQQRVLVHARKLIGEVEQILGRILGIEHGKRTDRRLARAQKMAQRALSNVQRWNEGTATLSLPERKRRRQPQTTGARRRTAR
jgi:predicted  nucleic acid-binding Zn-ribbon protein